MPGPRGHSVQLREGAAEETDRQAGGKQQQLAARLSREDRRLLSALVVSSLFNTLQIRNPAALKRTCRRPAVQARHRQGLEGRCVASLYTRSANCWGHHPSPLARPLSVMQGEKGMERARWVQGFEQLQVATVWPGIISLRPYP